MLDLESVTLCLNKNLADSHEARSESKLACAALSKDEANVGST